MSEAKGLNEVSKIRNTKKRNLRGYAYTFTINNYTEDDIIKITDPMNSINYDYIFQEEKGLSGTPHLQGYIKYKKMMTFNKVKKMMPSAHIEQAKNKYAAMNYCRKDDTREGKIYKNFDIDEVVDSQYTKKKTLEELLSIERMTMAEEQEAWEEKFREDMIRTMHEREWPVPGLSWVIEEEDWKEAIGKTI